MADAATYRELGEAAAAWVLRQVRDRDGPWLPEEITDAEAGDGVPLAPHADVLYDQRGQRPPDAAHPPTP
ncbi:hypothetical protein [Dactylosporangium sp. NPDC051484]|uniref:hypothetical protein n=1 Tax=Dactylosporangium sp. NPDC051484 TaxID=3154942 RepID=UPI00344C3FFB